MDRPARNNFLPLKSMALRQGLPYGVVMATAGASTVASAWSELRFLSTPLLALAIAQAVWILLSGAWQYRADFRLGCSAWLVLGPTHEHSGIHTVPLGIAVIAGGLTGLSSGEGVAWLLSLAVTGLCLTWIATILCVSRFIGSLAVHSLELKTVDGTWFLIPASLLGTGMVTAEFVAHLAEPKALILALLALIAVLLGWVGYWLVAAVASLRLLRFGLGGVPQAPWWTTMGCAGLAAAALTHVLENPLLSKSLQIFLTGAVAVTAILAIALFVPVAVGGLLFLIKSCRLRAKAPWPPTFSTAVCALGCMQAAEVMHSTTFRLLGLAASAATLLFWVITASWNSISPLTYR